MMPKEAKDTIALHNKLVALEDMEIPSFPTIAWIGNHSPKKQKERLSPTKHTKQT